MAELHRIYNGKGARAWLLCRPEAAVAELAEGKTPPSSLLRLSHRPGTAAGEQTEFVPFSVNLTQMLVKQLVEHALDEQGCCCLPNTTMWGWII
jgi:nucleoid-associated protein